MGKNNFFVRLCYGVVSKTTDTTNMTTKQVIDEFLKQRKISTPKEYFDKLKVKKTSSDIGINFFKQKRDFSNVPADKNYPDFAYGFGDSKLLNRKDHQTHAKELGFRNTNEYQKAAIRFWNERTGKIYYGKARKRFFMYDEKTSLMLVIDAEGIIHTFYEEKNFENKIKGWEALVEI